MGLQVVELDVSRSRKLNKMGESREARMSLRVHTDRVLICGATIALLSRTTLVNPHNVRETNKRMIICLNCHPSRNPRPASPAFVARWARRPISKTCLST